MAQTPQAFNYQAVLRDIGGNLLTSQLIGLVFAILESNDTGTVIHTETHSTTTNVYEVFNLSTGTDTTADDFTSIALETNTFWLI
ncbi:MAG: hypothetical protein HRT68_05305 [Flavobacteriaceae bacterium]|nr:hypothetical protein [Flavobacteriaceae bacterium]